MKSSKRHVVLVSLIFLLKYFSFIQTKSGSFHILTSSKFICDKTTAKQRWSFSKIDFWYLKATFCYSIPSSNLQYLPPDDSRVLLANTGIWQLATHLSYASNRIVTNGHLFLPGTFLPYLSYLSFLGSYFNRLSTTYSVISTKATTLSRRPSLLQILIGSFGNDDGHGGDDAG